MDLYTLGVTFFMYSNWEVPVFHNCIKLECQWTHLMWLRKLNTEDQCPAGNGPPYFVIKFSARPCAVPDHSCLFTAHACLLIHTHVPKNFAFQWSFISGSLQQISPCIACLLESICDCLQWSGSLSVVATCTLLAQGITGSKGAVSLVLRVNNIKGKGETNKEIKFQFLLPWTLEDTSEIPPGTFFFQLSPNGLCPGLACDIIFVLLKIFHMPHRNAYLLAPLHNCNRFCTVRDQLWHSLFFISLKNFKDFPDFVRWGFIITIVMGREPKKTSFNKNEHFDDVFSRLSQPVSWTLTCKWFCHHSQVTFWNYCTCQGCRAFADFHMQALAKPPFASQL